VIVILAEKLYQLIRRALDDAVGEDELEARLFGPLDGAKIITWDRRVWLGAIGTAAGLLFMELAIR